MTFKKTIVWLIAFVVAFGITFYSLSFLIDRLWGSGSFMIIASIFSLIISLSVAEETARWAIAHHWQWPR
ncbi:OB-fold-containig protein [Levilactobacillus enshiensis]|uniref:OB-fold-containig protein n=1 Tax=Levilactobacillus enshiensis TaxID=2590213 RepID=UPI00117AC146|nr:OB-fold-containig protein [Levilactobacillus enshiensis]